MHVKVILTADFRSAPGAPFGRPNADGSGPTYEFDLDHDDLSDADVCEIVFAICNSYPEELFCGQRYAGIVTAYRDQRLRSLSVGDTVVLTRGGDSTATFTVAAFGFTQV